MCIALQARAARRHTLFRTGEVHGRITNCVQKARRLVAYADSALATPIFWGECWSKLVTNVMANGMHPDPAFRSGIVSMFGGAKESWRHGPSQLIRTFCWYAMMVGQANSATTRRPSTGAKSNSFGLHSVAHRGTPPCHAKSLSQKDFC